MAPVKIRAISTISVLGLLTLGILVTTASSQEGSAPAVIEDNVAPALKDAKFAAHRDPGAVMTIVVGLKLHNEAEFRGLLDRLYDPESLDYHHWITPSDFLSRYSPNQADVDAVRAHLESHGLTVTRVSDNRVLVQATGAVAQVEEAFGVRINEYALGGCAAVRVLFAHHHERDSKNVFACNPSCLMVRTGTRGYAGHDVDTIEPVACLGRDHPNSGFLADCPSCS